MDVSTIPNAVFMTWDTPLKEVCPKCGATLFKRPENEAGFTVPRKGAITKGDSRLMTVSVIGAGLAGCEAALAAGLPRYSGNIARDEAGQVFPCAPVRGICGLVCSIR